MEIWRKRLCLAAALLAAFALWTAVVCTVDVQPIGPQGSAVGLAGINGAVHALTGVHLALYTATDWLSLAPAGVCVVFGGLGLVQWIGRRRLRDVDHSILILGGFYVVTGAAYLLFERFVVNYRPVLIEGVLEASYPSSTTVLVLCVMSTARMQIRERMGDSPLRRGLSLAVLTFMVLMVGGRLLSGVHWVSDIVGGALLSGGLVAMYDAACRFDRGRSENVPSHREADALAQMPADGQQEENA